MFRIIPSSQAKDFRNLLRENFLRSAHSLETRRLSTPGMPVENLELIWIADLGLWAHFSKRPVEGTRWVCWFGTQLPHPGVVSAPSIEINISVDTSRKALAGRAFVDGNGEYHLGHKGLLGGGRGGQMDMLTFASNLRGFTHEAVVFPNQSEEKVFDIGQIEKNGFLNDLRRFVLECERLRKLARAGSQTIIPPANDTIFDPENDRDGFGYRSNEQLYRIRREHGRVVNALQKTIGKNAKNGQRSFMRPDLYVEDMAGNINVLFEVKVCSDTQNWFTALGQLIVYGAHQSKTPKRVLVCPKKRTDTNFERALEILDVSVVTYEKSKRGYVFDKLNELF